MLEQAKYKAVWEHPEYRQISPGEECALIFKRTVHPERGKDCIDFGCGTGRGGEALAVYCGLKVTMLDFADNALDESVRETMAGAPDKLKFVQHDLTQPYPEQAMYGYCTDVMEHIPPEDVDKVLDNILTAARKVFFQIATVPDNCGALIGETLHLSVHPFEWWRDKLEQQQCIIRWMRRDNERCMFYVSRWVTAKDLVPRLAVNTEVEELKANLIANLALGLPEAQPHDTNDIEVMILAGGPSLNDFADEIYDKRMDGMPLITVNGTYNWAIERGMRPSMQVIADSREFNKRFVVPHVDTCRYLLSSVCHPEVVRAAPPAQTILWHAGDPKHVQEVLENIPGNHFPVHGGSTVMLRAIPLLRMLGYRKYHIYGWDSCLRETHHAYPQPENAEDLNELKIVRITVGERTFRCHLWMAAQAEEFLVIQKMIANEVEMAVYGDGLIAHIIKYKAGD